MRGGRGGRVAITVIVAASHSKGMLWQSSRVACYYQTKADGIQHALNQTSSMKECTTSQIRSLVSPAIFLKSMTSIGLMFLNTVNLIRDPDLYSFKVI